MEHQRIIDELEIRNIFSRMAQLADFEEDLKEYSTLFAEDGTWSLHPASTSPHQEVQEFTGRQSIVDGARGRRKEGRQGPGTHVMHDVATIAITFESSDIAHAESYWRLWGNTHDNPQVLGMGRYRDVFVRGEDGWQVKHRAVLPE